MVKPKIIDTPHEMSKMRLWSKAVAERYQQMWEDFKARAEEFSDHFRVQVDKPVTRPIDRLDPYERELCESEDSADHSALLLRLLLKGRSIDPDSAEEVLLHYEPRYPVTFIGIDLSSEDSDE